MEVFHAEGIWGVWYTVLWAATAPFAIMLLWTVFRVNAANSGEESTWLNGAVLGAFLTLLVTSFVSAILYARARPDRSWLTYAWWLVVHFIFWTFVGSGVFFASLQALAAGPRLVMRRFAAFLALMGVTVVHLAQLYAAHFFRHR